MGISIITGHFIPKIHSDKFWATFVESSIDLFWGRFFGYKEGWRDRAHRNPGNRPEANGEGANTRPETEL